MLDEDYNDYNNYDDYDDYNDYDDYDDDTIITITEKFVCTTHNSINNFYFYFWFLDNLESFEV